MKITELALNHKVTVFSGLIILILVGMNAYLTLPREAAPDVPIPIILVSTVYPGVAPEDMETLVTIPIEKKLKELSGVDELASTSSEGVSIVRIEFSPEIDLDQAFQRVRDKVDLAKPDLPEEAEEPVLTEINVSEFPILVLTLTGGTSVEKLEDIAENLSDKIEVIPGVLDAEVSGGREREIQVLVDPHRLQMYEMSLNDVIRSLQTENVNIPGGSVDIGHMKFTLRIPGEFERVDQIENIVVKARGGHPVFLRDLAEIRDDFKERQTYARFNGKESVTVTVRKRAGENIIRIVDRIKALLEEEKERITEAVRITLNFDESKDIRNMVNDLENNILSGIILIVAVLFFFMGFRNSVFVALAIPFSMLLTFFIVQAVGFTLNMVVLFSLILAVGMLVDNAVVIVENIYRHREEGSGAKKAAFLGTSEVGWPVIASTATTVAAFFPLMFWPDIIGEFMGYLPRTVIIVLCSSLFVAFIANPVFCEVFMKVKKGGGDRESSFRKGALCRRYDALLKKSLEHRWFTLGLCFTLLLGILATYGFFGRGVEFFPESDPRRVYIDLTFPEGTRLETSDRSCRRVESILEGKREVKNVITTVGGQSDQSGLSMSGGGAGSPHLSRIMVEFFDYEERVRPSTEVIEELRREVKALHIPGAVIDFQKEQQGPPQEAPVKIEISGDDFEKLGMLAEKVKRRIKDVPGLVDLKDDFESGRPEFRFDVDREKASRFKLSTYDIAMTLRTAVNGTEASTFRDGDEEYDITVRLPERHRDSMDDLLNLTVTNNDGDSVLLSRLVRAEHTAGWGSIARKDTRKTVSVSGNNAEGVNANALLAAVQKKLEDFEAPSGYLMRFSGQQEEQNKNQAFLQKAFLIALLLILFVLVTEFNSVTMPAIILVAVLLSLFGVFTGLLVTGTPFGIIMTGIGVISLAGIVVNNAIVLIDSIRQLRERGYSQRDAVIEGGLTRLRPVLLTAITTIAGLIPLSTGYGFDFRKLQWLAGSESSEWWGPMGKAVIFGLAFATLLTLVVVPVMYTIVDDFEEWTRSLFHEEEDAQDDENGAVVNL